MEDSDRAQNNTQNVSGGDSDEDRDQLEKTVCKYGTEDYHEKRKQGDAQV